MLKKLKNLLSKYGNIPLCLCLPIAIYLDTLDTYDYENLTNVLFQCGLLGFVWSVANIIKWIPHTTIWKYTKDILPLWLQKHIYFFLFLFYPLTKIILAFFNLNWRTDIDMIIFGSCMFGILLVFLMKQAEQTPVFVLIIILCLSIPFVLITMMFGYELCAITDAEEIVEEGQRYVIGRENISLHHWYEHKYKVIDPCFRSAIPVEKDIHQLEEQYND